MTEKQSHILVVDDNPDNLRLVAGVLKGRGYTVRPARDGRTALNSAISNPPDLILLDILMPGMDGYETCRRIKADEKTRDVPIIFISALDDAFDKVKAFTAGCVDYVSKPFNAEELLARIETHLSLRDARKELGEKNARLQREIEERKRAENNAKESEKRFAAVMNSMEAIMYVADMETHELLFINQYTRDLFGDIDGEICWRTLQTDQDGPCEFCTNKHLVKNGEPTGVYTWDFQNTVTGRWCHIQDQAILWPDGRLVRMEIASDISDLKRKEKTLRKQNQYMEALHKTSIDLISRLDLDDLLQNILARAVSLANVTDGFIHLYVPEEDALEIRYAVGAFANHIGFKLKPGEGLAGKVWQTGRSLRIEDYRAWDGRAKN
ncbi:MAG: response regulator, partial [Desulfobacterales bacterium]|nr:response regulator [Desulfobacterales bacterium]